MNQWLNISNTVSTTVAADIAIGTVAVTPASMANIVPGFLLTVDVGANQEEVSVISVTGSTFTATFTIAHNSPPTALTGSNSDAVMSRLITSCSQYILSRTQRTTFNLTSNYNEVRNGNGNSRMALLIWPCASVNSVTIDNIVIQPSPDGVQSGWASDTYSVFLLGSYTVYYPTLAPGAYPGFFRKGYQNVQFNYNYGYATLPADVNQACIELVSLRFVNMRTPNVGMKSSSLSGIGTTSYITSAEPDSVTAVINRYKIRLAWE